MAGMSSAIWTLAMKGSAGNRQENEPEVKKPEPGAKPGVVILVENLPVPLDRRVWQEACALRDAGYAVSVICPRMRGHNSAYEDLEGIRIYRHFITEEAGSILGFLGEYASALWGEFGCLCKAWRQGAFQIIHICNPPDLLFIPALPFKIFCGCRIIYDVHDLTPEMFEAKFYRKGFLYWCVRLAERCTLAVSDFVIATNESVLRTIQKRGKKKAERTIVVRTAPNALDTTVEPDAALKNGRKHLAGYIGVLGSSDGVDYLVKAANYLVNHQKREDIQFLIMGSGPEYQKLVSLRDEYGLQDHVSMPGRVSNEYLFVALQTMDIGLTCDPINPYNQHCTMNKVLEYMTFGKAQVMLETTEGRFSAGDAALYIKVNSVELFAEGIAELLADPEKRRRMGEIGRARIQGPLNWSISVENLLTAYAKARSRRRRWRGGRSNSSQ